MLVVMSTFKLKKMCSVQYLNLCLQRCFQICTNSRKLTMKFSLIETVRRLKLSLITLGMKEKYSQSLRTRTKKTISSRNYISGELIPTIEHGKSNISKSWINPFILILQIWAHRHHLTLQTKFRWNQKSALHTLSSQRDHYTCKMMKTRDTMSLHT